MDLCIFLINGICTYDINGDKADLAHYKAEAERLKRSVTTTRQRRRGAKKIF